MLFDRNEFLMSQCSSNNSSYFPKAKKTGTTIAGIIFKDGVVLGADTRATEVKILACLCVNASEDIYLYLNVIIWSSFIM